MHKTHQTETPVVLLLTVEQAMQTLSISRTVLYQLMKTEQIVTVKIGRARRVVLQSIQAFIEQQSAR